MKRWHRFLAAGAALFALASTPGCGQGVGKAPLHGLVTPIPRRVAGTHVREVRAPAPDTTFAFRARPGGLLFVFFGFTNCPDVCPTTLGDLRRATRKLGRDAERLDVAFVTVDRVRDTSEVLLPYVHAYFAHGHALLARSQEELLAVQAAFGATSSVTRRANGLLDVAHTAASYLVDERGLVVLEWDFGIAPKAMANDLHVLLARVGPRP